MTDRTEAAHNAMVFAREASEYEGDRVRHNDAWAELARTQPDDWMTRVLGHEAERDAATRNRDTAITMAHMWAAVAAVQEQP